jgi:hypothetical protein
MRLQSKQFGHAFWGANFTTVAYNRKRFYNSYTRMAVKLFNWSSFLNILNNENQIFNNLSESEKLSYILNSSPSSQVNKLGSF